MEKDFQSKKDKIKTRRQKEREQRRKEIIDAAERLVTALAGGRLQPSLVLHVNHPRELSAPLHLALQPLRLAGITLLNQSVLLRGVNDSADTLCELSESLFASGVLPYYLHLLDPVRGAAHFEVPQAEATQLQHRLRRLLPGYLLPRLVRDRPGADCKTIVL